MINWNSTFSNSHFVESLNLTDYIALTGLILLLAFGLHQYYQSQRKYKNLPPGPKPSFLLGNTIVSFSSTVRP